MVSKGSVVEGRYLADISKQIDRHIGKDRYVLHEIVSPTVHIDIHVIAPNQQFPYLTIMTSGMSDIDMVVPKGATPAEDYKLAEVIAFLPADWPIDQLANSTEEGTESPGWYPIRWLKHYARMAHERNTALSWYVSTSNGAPASPIGEATDMVGFLFSPAIQLGGEGLFVPTRDDRKIRILNLVPILGDEVQFAMKKGGEALCGKLDQAENFVFDPVRKSCLIQQKRKKIFGLF